MHAVEIIVTAAIGFALIGAAGYFMTIYNGLIAMKNNIGRSWANIDVLLKQRHDELPKLVKTCEAYMQHERAIFDKLSDARGAVLKAKTVGERGQAENFLTQALGQFFAVAENYPDLKANQSFLALQTRITEIENHIADRREFYNDTVTVFNTRIQQIPDTLVANWLRLEAHELFKIDPLHREDVTIAFKHAS
jgi:LemA protein